MGNDFFEDKKAPAVLKHAILSRYLHVFASKTGKSAPGGRVAYLDGFAGPGTYGDGTEGSPALALQTAQKVSGFRKLEGTYIEKDPSSCAELRRLLAQSSHKHTVLEGDIATSLTSALSGIGDSTPLVAFIDPFGLPPPMERLFEIIGHANVSGGRRRGPATELIINFMHPAVRRQAGHLDSVSDNVSYKKAQPKLVANVDAALGGDWWQKDWRESTGDRPEHRVLRLSRGYLQRLVEPLNGGSWGWMAIPVRSRWNGPIVYEILFVTTFPREGLWSFRECASSAIEEFYQYCRSAQLDLDLGDDYEGRIVADVKQALETLLAKGQPFKVIDEQKALHSAIGLPREKHIRKAIKQLFEEGKTSTNGVGKVPTMLVRPK